MHVGMGGRRGAGVGDWMVWCWVDGCARCARGPGGRIGDSIKGGWVHGVDFHGGQLMADHHKLELLPLSPPKKQATDQPTCDQLDLRRSLVNT